MQNSFLILLSCLPSLALALELPSAETQAHSSSVRRSANWWAQVGPKVYYSPPTSFLGLSQNVSEYYYVMGSKSALTDTMKERVVGGHGRWHIMHLPKGPSMLEVSQRVSQQSRSGDRRASLSALKQLKSGTVLSSDFPAYGLSGDYVHPLDEAGQELEKAAVADVTSESTMDFLTKITQFPTRSYSNSTASDKVEHFLKSELEGMGLHTCFHNFAGGATQLTNIVAHIPGQQPGSVTVGAHYDSRPFDGKAPGAEDNGSGLASMLALAKAFTSNKVAPKKSVYFVAFAGEEPGLLGSKAFAQSLQSEALPSECNANGESLLQTQKSGQKRRTKVRDDTSLHSAIIMDEIGWLSPKLKTPTVNLESYDGLGAKVMQHLRQSTMLHNGDSMEVVHNANPFGSDHMSFLDLSMEAALTINGDDEAYPNYHQSTDTIDNVNGDYMAKIAKMNMGGLMRMSL